MARCIYSGRRGQCTRAQIDGSQFCRQHSNESDRMKNYRINDPSLKDSYLHHGDEESLRSIAQDIQLLRAMTEDRLNLATSPAERISAMATVAPWLASIHKLVNTLETLRRTSSEVLSKTALDKLGNKIVEILVTELNDIPGRDRIIDRIAEQIAEAIIESKNES